MKHVILGTSGVPVSILCLGAMHYGSREADDLSMQLLDRFCEAGGDFIDTANIYAHWTPTGKGGDSEILLGKWMKTRGNRRQVFIASKVGFAYPGTEFGLGARQIETECERSLKRLGTETIDLYYAHVDDRKIPLEEVMGAFEKLVRSGKVRFVGGSNYRAWRLEKARQVSLINGWVTFCCIQQRYTYLRPAEGASFGAQISGNTDLLDYSKSESVTIVAYSPLLAGAYARTDRQFQSQYLTHETDRRLKTLNDVAVECQATPNQVILAWMMHSDPPVIPVFGASTMQQMDENLGSLDVHLSEEQMKRLNE